MARCEDFPCCGHELGCCPDFDESGRQLNMVCICGAKLPVNNRSSICDSCLRSGSDDLYDDADFEDDGQPSEYDEWQDYYGGDDWDHGQYDDESYHDY